MADIKLNKTEMKKQKTVLAQLSKYLPTLQLKKQQLQVEVDSIRSALDAIETKLNLQIKSVEPWAMLLSQPLPVKLETIVKLDDVIITTENIAGVDVPVFKDIVFTTADYSHLSMPVWIDRAAEIMISLITLREKRRIAAKKLSLIEEELRQTNIKVNLFEKRMIPECSENIRKIKIFLGDQEIASICNAKIAKDKLEKKNMAEAV